MTKQRAISLKLAQWLGLQEIGTECRSGLGIVVTFRKDDWRKPIFNPFASTIEGRAQFAECVIKAGLEKDIGADLLRNAVRSGWDEKLHRVNHDNTPEGITAATLEAIYYAIGGTAGEWEEEATVP